jgi:uncharacterized protein (DUF1684 family)
MTEPAESLDLWDYRRRVAEIYREVRGGVPGVETHDRWRRERDELFRDHASSPIPAEARPRWGGLSCFPYDPVWRFAAVVEEVEPLRLGAGHSGSGETPLVRFGRVHGVAGGTEITLSLFWLDTYGGGVFLPFRDVTNGGDTYGGGRYLLDTAKGADLGHDGGTVILDFNYAYHPSCVHDPRWSCPLAPPENTVAVAITAGERLPG